MRNWIRRWLGIEEIINQQEAIHYGMGFVNTKLDKLDKILGQAVAANQGMGRLIAKLDPTYGQDELDPARKKASDELSDQVIRRLIAEHIFSNRMQNGDEL